MAALDPARRLAFEVLRRVEEAGAYADLLLGERLRRTRPSAADRGLATRLVYGTLAWQGRLDWHLVHLCSTPPDRLDPWLRVILRLGLYQILFLDRVPAYAAVDTSVELARGFKHGAAAGLVNATLRRAATGTDRHPLPDPGADPVTALAVRWSHPTWLVARWRAELGDAELEPLLRADQEPAPTVLRVNTLRGDRPALLDALHRETCEATPTAYAPEGVRIGGGLDTTAGLFAAGRCTIQGEASQIVAHLVGARPGERVLDACAAPGGKATHLAALMEDRGELIAVDPNERGLAHLRDSAQRLGISIIRTFGADARRLPATLAGGPGTAAGPFDRILVDAPCSGLGTLRAHPELRWRRQEADLQVLARLQQEILAALAPHCAPGGVLVYATCTISRVENEEVVAAFRRAHPEFAIEDPRNDLPASAGPLVDAGGMLRTFPHRHGLDGFFAVRLRRR